MDRNWYINTQVPCPLAGVTQWYMLYTIFQSSSVGLSINYPQPYLHSIGWPRVRHDWVTEPSAVPCLMVHPSFAPDLPSLPHPLPEFPGVISGKKPPTLESLSMGLHLVYGTQTEIISFPTATLIFNQPILHLKSQTIFLNYHQNHITSYLKPFSDFHCF